MRKKLIVAIALVSAIACSGYLYFKSRDTYTSGHFKKTSQKLFPESREINAVLNFSMKEDHVLTIRYKPNKYPDKVIFFNDTEVHPSTFPYMKIEDGVEKNYIHIPPRLINSGTNILKIVFSNDFPQEVSLRLCNYRKDLFNSIYILASESGYKIVATSDFFLHIAIVLTLIFVLYCAKEAAVAETSRFLFEQRSLSWKIAFIFFAAFLILNICTYWLSFNHLFRHDEWFLFFSTKDLTADFKFFIEHIDWQLHLPYDRLTFRPIHHGILAFNRVVFDTNYVGPHILTFCKHLIACLSLWLLMMEFNPRRVSVLFVLLFSVLVINIDTVIWPHLDAYITTTALTLLAFIFFRKGILNNESETKYFLTVAVILLVNILNTEIGFLVPACFFFSYWVIYKRYDGLSSLYSKKPVYMLLLLPMIFWALLFAIHLYAAYPNLEMTSQSDSIGLLWPLFNTARFIFLTMAGAIYPFTDTIYADKIYFKIPVAGILWAILLAGACIRYRKKIFRPIPKEAKMASILAISASLIVCFGRASYVDSLLANLMLPTHYTYFVAAMGICAFYGVLDFEKIKKSKTTSSILLMLFALLISSHSFKTFQSNKEIENKTCSLKNYFNSVRGFVSEHSNEPDFSFKIIDKPPTIDIFPWYHQTCTDGLFNKYISYNKPKYLLQYDYKAKKLNPSLCNDHSVTIDSDKALPIFNSDYVNSIGMDFKKVSINDKSLLIGVTEVTQKQWRQIMGYNPSRFINDAHPVENVPFKMIKEFISRLDSIEETKLYRLPTENEYNCLINQASSKNPDVWNNPKGYSWLKQNSGQVTHIVGAKNPLPEGLFDIIGNVWEWTSTVIHPRSPAAGYEDNPRACFGLSWRDQIKDRENMVTYYPTDFRHSHLGFRLVCEPQNGK